MKCIVSFCWLSAKSSDLHPIPTGLVAPVALTVNLSLSVGSLPSRFKSVLVFLFSTAKTPISLRITWKVTDQCPIILVFQGSWKSCGKSSESHINSSNTSNHYQSAYGNFHSTETALLKIHDDILSSTDYGRVTALTLLDLSAAFNTIDHTIFLRIRDEWFGVTGKALGWFKLYLTGRCQRITLGDCLSSISWPPFWSPSMVTPLSSMVSGRAIPHHLDAIDSPLHQVTVLRHWMVYNSAWPLYSHGCQWINWNWTQLKLNSSL